MMEIVLRFGVLTIHIWPRLYRVALVHPLRQSVTLSLQEFQEALALAKERSRSA